MTWNDFFCGCVDDVNIWWWQMFNFVFLFLKRLFQYNSRTVGIHFAREVTLNNWEMIVETLSYIFRWRSRCYNKHPIRSDVMVKNLSSFYGGNFYLMNWLDRQSISDHISRSVYINCRKSIVKSWSVGACNSHTVPMSRHFHRLIYF